MGKLACIWYYKVSEHGLPKKLVLYSVLQFHILVKQALRSLYSFVLWGLCLNKYAEKCINGGPTHFFQKHESLRI